MIQDDPLTELWLRLDDIGDATDDDILTIIQYERKHRLSGAKAVKDKPEPEAPTSLRELLPTVASKVIIRRR